MQDIDRMDLRKYIGILAMEIEAQEDARERAEERESLVDGRAVELRRGAIDMVL